MRYSVIITGSRIAIAALIVAFIARVRDDLKRNSIGAWMLAGIFISIGVYLTAILIQNTQSIWTRSAGLLSFQNVDLIRLVWDQIDLSYDPIGQEAVNHTSNYDMSWWMRIHKWCYAIKIYYLHPECYLQGIGPGFAMAAVDGAFAHFD